MDTISNKWYEAKNFRNNFLVSSFWERKFNLLEKIGKIRVGSIKKELNNYDLIFVPAQSEVLAWIKTDTPIIYYSDATIPW